MRNKLAGSCDCILFHAGSGSSELRAGITSAAGILYSAADGFQVWSTFKVRIICFLIIALALYPMAYITRLTKTSMLDALGQDYVRTARAKGCTADLSLIFKHALRNALIPVITYVGPMLASILTGSLVVENIFTIGGLGAKFITGITTRDYPMIMGTTIFLATLMVIMNLLSDIVYKLVDPRITFE